MARKELSDEALQMIAHRFKALSEPIRLKLIMALMDGPKNVKSLVEVCGAAQANVSRHLQTLTDAGILERRREGLHVHYEIIDESLPALCDLACGSVEKFLKTKVNAFR